MNIYKISQDRNRMYDTYDSAIVVAKDEESAKLIHPSWGDENNAKKPVDWWKSSDPFDYFDWTRPKFVKVEFVGTTDKFEEGTVLSASYNAG